MLEFINKIFKIKRLTEEEKISITLTLNMSYSRVAFL
ncbi:Hypothetical protein TPAS_1163 [Trichococcus pasteurii]|uniref:Uncharacterized protein n=1 Tax=Trichococcus pasteurii TaxID=43064 RepID=A0A1W1IEP4_9LACT|nr:Hypothetical protein TPAS_1163 [Trichococcus pasteurii]SSB92368.1 Hypothetical protein TPAS_1163 [Trichococcus pasteurii]